MTPASLAILTRTLAAPTSEARRLRSYRDTTGNITVGVGHNITAHGITITDELCDRLLADDIARVVDTLALVLGWVADLDEVRQRVIYEMAFNLGVKGLLGFHATLTCVRAGLYPEAARHMLDSLWADQVGKHPGQRAYRLAEAMRTGIERIV